MIQVSPQARERLHAMTQDTLLMEALAEYLKCFAEQQIEDERQKVRNGDLRGAAEHEARAELAEAFLMMLASDVKPLGRPKSAD